MKPAFTHAWDLSPAAARALQSTLAPQVERRNRMGVIRRVAGVDVGFENGGRTTRAAVVVMDAQSLETLDEVLHREPTCFPYVPGLLSFREIPALLGAFRKLSIKPDLLMCDGQGIAHPRRLGIAAHLGLLMDLPAIGVGKSRLVGEYEEPGNERGAWSALRDRKEVIGRVLRTRSGVRPLFISTGHRVSLPTAARLVLACASRFRLPEHRYAPRTGCRPAVARTVQADSHPGTLPAGPRH